MPDKYVPSELEEAFDAAWIAVGRHKCPIMPSEEAQLRLSLARHIVRLSNSGITDRDELRRRAISLRLVELVGAKSRIPI